MARQALSWVSPLALLASGAAVACSSSPAQGTVTIVTVDDPFTGPPAASTITVQALDLDGGVTTIASPQPISQGTVDLGTHGLGDIDALRVVATDTAGTTVAWGETLAVQLGAISQDTPLPIFVQRTGTLSRMPNPLADGRHAPLVGVLGGRYIFETGGSESQFQTQSGIYDLISWGPLGSPPSLSSAPESMALLELEVLAINAAGATWYDLSTTESGPAATPTGTGSWADVAGGQTIYAPDGSSYVIGGTRAAGTPSAAVLIVSTSGTLSYAQLKAPRLGASAAWVTGVGLVIAGGSGDASAAGVEVIGSATATTSVALPYPADATAGAGLDALDATHLVLVGGTTPSGGGTGSRRIDLSCTTGCAATAWGAALPSALTLAQAFAIDAASVFVVGEDATGAMHAYRLSASAAQEVPFRVPRSHARAVRLPIGSVAVVGGDVNIESFVP